MRKALLLATAGLLGVAFAGPAAADVFVVGSLEKTKEVTVTEEISILKNITVDVEHFFELDSAAEALAIANILNHDNLIDRETSVQAEDGHIEQAAVMTGSVGGNPTGQNGNQGIVGVNQDAGVGVNQGNLVAFAFTDEPDSFVNAEASADQRVLNNTLDWGRVFGNDFISVSASIAGSINNNLGIVGVNQNAGVLNNQTTSLAVGAAVDIFNDCGCVLAVAEADLGQEISGNTVTEANSRLSSRMNRSVNGNTGVTMVNQSSGLLGNQASNYAINATITNQALIPQAPNG